MIFVDTSAWFAAIVPTDSDHLNAMRWLAANSEPLLTTDYVIDETLTLLRARGERRRALALGEGFFQSGICEICFIVNEDLSRARDVFRLYDDKDWSFTDCASKTVMERLEIKRAFSFDRHFRQFGSIKVLPQDQSGRRA